MIPKASFAWLCASTVQRRLIRGVLQNHRKITQPSGFLAIAQTRCYSRPGVFDARAALRRPEQKFRMKTYTYRPFQNENEIRVLAVQPSKIPDDVIVCRIGYTSIDVPKQEIDYEALSYHWGSPVKSESILIQDDHELGKQWQISITVNLLHALRRLRHQDEERHVWADAICINQEDGDEKISQIAKMSQIYSSGTGVIVYLGDTNETSPTDIDESIEAVMLLNDLIHQRAAKGSDQKDFDPYANNLGTSDLFFWWISSEESARRWWALLRLFRRPWFFRIWILQELILAQNATVIWGHRTIDWEKVFAAASIIHIASNRVLQPFDVRETGIDAVLMMGSWKDSMSFDKSTKPFINAMVSFRNFQASEARDKYNGVLGLLGKGSNAIPSNNDAAVLFKDLALVAIALFGDIFSMLGFIDGKPESSRLALPSWMPDWSQVRVPEGLKLNAVTDGSAPKACGASQPMWSLDESCTVLRVTGKPMATIQEVSSVYEPPVNDIDGFPDFDSLARETRRRTKACLDEYIAIFNRSVDIRFSKNPEFAQSSTAMEMRHSWLWNTLICGRHMGGETADPEEGEYFDKFLAFYQNPDLYLNVGTSPTMYDHAWEAGRFEALMKRWSMMNRVFFGSHEGWFGWAPRHAEPGDIITIFAGAPVPFLLRPTPELGQYRVLGECWVHGFMDGKRFDADQRVMNHIVLV